MILFLHPIQWADNPKLKRVWKITREESLSTRDNRYALLPRSSLEFSYSILTTSVHETENLQLLLTHAKSDLIQIPLWIDEVELTSPVISGETSLSVTDTTGRRFEERLLLLMEGEKHESKSYSQVFLNSILIESGLSENFSIGAKVYPLLTGYFTKKPNLSWITDEVVTTEISFREVLS